MASRSRTLYIGVTGNLHQRVFQHKWKECDGFTARYNCDRLVWFEKFQYIQKAIAREKELKGWRRAKKIALIHEPGVDGFESGLVRMRAGGLSESIGSDECLKQHYPLRRTGATSVQG